MGLRGPKRKETDGLLEAAWSEFFRALTGNLCVHRTEPILSPPKWFNAHYAPDMEHCLIQTSKSGEEIHVARHWPKEMKDEFQRWFNDEKNWYVAQWCEWPGPEPDIFEKLLRARSVRQVRATCEDSCRWKDLRFVDLSLYLKTSNFILYLWHHAREFLQARNSARFPRSRRPKSEEKRIKFLAHAMANICVGLSPLTLQHHNKKSKGTPT